VAGYDVVSFEDVYFNGVSTSGGPSLLGGSWAFTPAAGGSLANTFDDGTSVPGLIFGGLSVGYFDTFSQTFATTPGETYMYSFTFTQGNDRPSELVVTSTAAAVTPTIPEPSTRAMILFGFAALGFVGYRTSRRTMPARCFVPDFDGAFLSSDSKDALWDKFYTGAPQRQRRSVERYNIVKRA
jgi:hypothetical protein